MEIFSAEWAATCGDLLRQSASYRTASPDWEGDLVFRILNGDGLPGPAVYFDLWHGELRAVRPATTEDQATSKYLIEGSADTWQQVLDGRLAPLLALMTARMKLSRGKIPDLVPHANSARELLTLMSTIPATFPA